MSVTYTYYVKYNGFSYYAVASYYLHTQLVYTKDGSGNILSNPAPYSADSYGYDFVKWSEGTYLNSTYVSSLPAYLFDGATSYDGASASSITLTYANKTAKLTEIIGTFKPQERFAWAYGTDAPTTVAPTTEAPTTVAPTTVTPSTVTPTTVAPIFYPTFYPTIIPIQSVKDKSLDFAFNDMSYAFTHLQKHDDDKHATLTITDTNNLMFNGQLLGDSVALPFYDPVTASDRAHYDGLPNSYRYESYLVNTHYIDNVNIHTFRAESTYNKGQSHLFGSSFGIVSSNWWHGSQDASYAYILNFNEGVLNYSIYDRTNKKFVSDSAGLPVHPFGGDRLKWDSTNNKYLLNQFGVTTVDANTTDPIPTATSSKDGLFSKSSYSYVYNETGKLRTDVDALKKVTQAPCAYYVDFDTSPLFYRGASTGVKTTTYTHGNFWDQLLEVSNAVKRGLQIIGYSNNPQTISATSYSYINVSSAYFGCLFNSPVGDDSYCIKTHYTYNCRVYYSYIYMSSTFYNHSSSSQLSYLMMAYVSPLNMQEITSSNEGTFTK